MALTYIALISTYWTENYNFNENNLTSPNIQVKQPLKKKS